MDKKKAAVVIGVFILCHFGFAQKTDFYVNDLKAYTDALHLYRYGQYAAAAHEFEGVGYPLSGPEIKSATAYYTAGSAIRLRQPNAGELMEEFIKKYPVSSLRNRAYRDMANFYFANRKYSNALQWYSKTNPNLIANGQRDYYNFNYGYALFATGKHDQANRYFRKVSNSPEYGARSKYYIGFSAYQQGDYDMADMYFKQLPKTDLYQNKILYYDMERSFATGDYKKAATTGKQLLNKLRRRQRSNVSKAVGESYFNLKQYEEAIPYLKNYRGKRGRWKNTDFYQLGYAYYKQGDYKNAIANFNKITGAKDSLAQNAYYHLAECYMKTAKKQQALNAFRSVSQMDFDPKIQQDAWLNYAKLSYEIGNPYQSVPSVLNDYLKKYPKSPDRETIGELLINSYISSNDYEAALKILKDNRYFKNKLVYQKVAFYRAVALFNEGDYKQAAVYFKKSLQEPHDNKFRLRAVYWNAETAYRMGNYDSALAGFIRFLSLPGSVTSEEFKNVYYNLAYTYFKKKEYLLATRYFQKFIDSNPTDTQFLNDSYLRLGDSYFASGSYAKAIAAYDKAILIKKIDEDYAFFQKAMSYGLAKENNKKIHYLNIFLEKYPKSGFRDDVLYELAGTYVETDNTSQALQVYQKLIDAYPASSFVPKSLLKKGLVYYNTDKNEEALASYKQLVKKFPNTSEARQAVANARRIYVDLGRIDDYAEWVKGISFVEITNADLDNAAYEFAEKKFFKNNLSQAVAAFESYLKKFPKGLHVLQAHFYLAQSLYNTVNKKQAIPYYSYVTEQPKNEFTEQALVKLTKIYLENSDWEKALPLLNRFDQEAEHLQNRIFAQANLMKGNYALGNYEKAKVYAEELLQNNQVETDIKNDAKVIVARTAIQNGAEKKAKVLYKEIASFAQGALKAETLYYDAYFKNKEKRYQHSNKVISKLASDYSSYKEWGAKGLLLMARNFDALNDTYQATYILENLIKNFTDYPPVTKEAKKLLKQIKSRASKRNESVKDKDIE